MDHVAILNKKIASIDSILNKDKTIESRWYKNKVTPWNKIQKGDTVFFKYSGGKVTAKADVSNVLQFELNKDVLKEILYKYAGVKFINLSTKDPNDIYFVSRRYCILVFLTNPKEIKPFDINKKGFGISSAWLSLKNINAIMI